MSSRATVTIVGIVAVLIASVLFAAGMLQLLSVYELPRLGDGFEIIGVLGILGIALTEIVLGFSLLSASKRRLPWLAAMVVFAIASVYAMWMLLQGMSSSACLGDVRIPTLGVLTISLVCFAILTISLNQACRVVFCNQRYLRRLGYLILAGIGIFVGINFVSGGAIIRSWTGPPLIVMAVQPPSEGIDFLFGDEYEFSVTITNQSAVIPRRILGCHGGYAQVQSLPIVICAGESKIIRVRAKAESIPMDQWVSIFDSEAKSFLDQGKTAKEALTNLKQRVFLTTDYPRQPVVEVAFVAAATEQYIKKIDDAMRRKSRSIIKPLEGSKVDATK